LNYASIRTCDIANGEGVRVSLFVSGCTHRCPGCFNEEAQAFDYGRPFTREVEDEILDALAPDYIAGLTLLGGEPMEPANQRVLVPFLRRFRERYGTAKTLWVYTGCVLEELDDMTGGRWKVEGDEKVRGEKEGGESRWREEGEFLSRTRTPTQPSTSNLQPSAFYLEGTTTEFLRMIDVLVDGPFVLALKDISLKFRGSSNQRILRHAK